MSPSLSPTPLGPSPAQAAIGLLACLLLPVALTLLLRVRALRAAAADPAPVWFGFARTTSWIVLGSWIAWIAEVHLMRVTRFVPLVLPAGGILPIAAAVAALYLLPPTLVMIAVAALSHRVAARLRGASWTLRETLSQAAWQQAAFLVPLFCLVLGVSAILAGSPRSGVALVIAALASRLVLLRLQLRAMGIAPHALTSGPLRDRIFALASQAGVKLQQLYVVPMARSRMANAFAVRGNVVVLTDYLLEHLSRREVDAVMAHELTHLKRGHPFLLALTLAFTWVIVAILPSVMPFHMSWPLAVALALPAGIVLFGLVSRRFEREADAGAVALTGDAEALITGLARLTRLNTMPLDWGRLGESLLTHPSTRRRALVIGARAGLAGDRIETLLRSDLPQDEHYAAGAGGSGLSSGQSKVFSSLSKISTGALLGWTSLAIAALTPAALIALARVTGVRMEPRWAFDAALFLLATAVSCAALDRMVVSPYAGMKRRLRQRLIEQGIDQARERGIYVGLSPETRPRVYEGFYDWDIGLLFVRDDTLCFVGEEARFALRRGQVASFAFAPRPPGWFAGYRIAVTWEDARSGASGSFTLRPADTTAIRHAARDARGLMARLEAWKGDGGPQAAMPAKPSGPAEPVLAGLGPPAFGSVTAIDPRQIANARTLPPMIILGALLAAGACALFGLPFAPGAQAGFMDVFAVGLMVHLFHRLPYWLWRDSPAEERPASIRRAA